MSITNPPSSRDHHVVRATREAPGPDDSISVRIRKLNHSFGQGELAKQVLFDNDLELTRGETVIMTGPSGSGKTTLLTLIGGLRSIQDGSLEVNGRQLHGLSQRQLTETRRNIGFIFQQHNLFSSLTAMQNVRMALELRETNNRKMNDKAAEILTQLGLGHRLNYKPQKLSGGQRQRVAIARALVNRPSIILADEPTAALDKQTGRDVVDLFKKFAKENGCTILMVTHDNRILDVADRIVNMVDGRIISDVVVSAAAAVCEFLRCCTPFKNMTPANLSSVADRVEVEKQLGEVPVIRQGDPGDKFYIIRSGRAEVLIEDANGVRRMAELGAGDFFGEGALLTGAPRSATVRSLEPMEMYVLGKQDFHDAMEASQSFKDELRHALFERQ
ncbi:MAG: ATP-binding cassette domain-containing protein [Planctomycetaceae bacterium]|nr:ATP-binding cassette domain-containing protein [Planctomycetaceae bacterium]